MCYPPTTAYLNFVKKYNILMTRSNNCLKDFEILNTEMGIVIDRLIKTYLNNFEISTTKIYLHSIRRLIFNNKRIIL